MKAFMMTTIGCSSIFLNMFISKDRYYRIKQSLKPDETEKTFSYETLASLLLGLVCSVPPLFGWSFYSMEKGLTSCSVEWNLKNWNVSTYNIFLLIIAFLVPIYFMIVCNVKLFKIVKISHFYE